MSITEVVNMVTAFVVATGPIAISLAILGHALVASPWPKVQRIGKILEGIGWDLKRVSEAFKRGEPPKKDPPNDPPGGGQTPVAAKPIPVVLPTGSGLTTLALAFVLTGCGFGAPNVPDESCPDATRVATVECPALAVAGCEGKPWAECAAREQIEAECHKRIDVALEACE
jgi:hypothetical protein